MGNCMEDTLEGVVDSYRGQPEEVVDSHRVQPAGEVDSYTVQSAEVTGSHTRLLEGDNLQEK